MSSWTQLYLTGLPETLTPTDQDIESALDNSYQLSTDNNLQWAGIGTTLIKRNPDGIARGFGFISFHSKEGAVAAMERINNCTLTIAETTIVQLKAEVSIPKKKLKKEGDIGKELPDLRCKRRRGAPVRKHPVIRSSDGKKTNLGNKTK